MTFEQFKKGIKAIPLSTWKKIFVPIICVFILPLIVLIYTSPPDKLTFKNLLTAMAILVVPIVLSLYILRWISDFLSD